MRMVIATAQAPELTGLEGVCHYLVEQGFGGVAYFVEAESVPAGMSEGCLLDLTLEQRYGARCRICTDGPRRLFMSFAEATPDLDHASFDRWYESRHIPDIEPLGFEDVRRYVTADRRHYIVLAQIDSPAVFDNPLLWKVQGFGPFDHQIRYTRFVLRRVAA